jgi:hypothetical protein
MCVCMYVSKEMGQDPSSKICCAFPGLMLADVTGQRLETDGAESYL